MDKYIITCRSSKEVDEVYNFIKNGGYRINKLNKQQSTSSYGYVTFDCDDLTLNNIINDLNLKVSSMYLERR